MRQSQQQGKPAESQYLFGHGVRGDVGHSVGYGEDLVGLAVRDLDAELLLDGHDHLHGVQRVKVQVVLEVRGGAHFVVVDLRRQPLLSPALKKGETLSLPSRNS